MKGSMTAVRVRPHDPDALRLRPSHVPANEFAGDVTVFPANSCSHWWRVGQHVLGRTLNSSGTCGPTVRLSEQGLFVVCNYVCVCIGAVDAKRIGYFVFFRWFGAIKMVAKLYIHFNDIKKIMVVIGFLVEWKMKSRKMKNSQFQWAENLHLKFHMGFNKCLMWLTMCLG